jgi:hypothetical protein
MASCIHSYKEQNCGAKIDADFNAARNIAKKINPIYNSIWVYNNSFNALRCRDDWLKAGMNMEETHASL